jgi:hypothetical protein
MKNSREANVSTRHGTAGIVAMLVFRDAPQARDNFATLPGDYALRRKYAVRKTDIA